MSLCKCHEEQFMKYLYTELESSLPVLEQAIAWWREFCAPIVAASNGRWKETPRKLSLNGIEVDFSNPVYELESNDGKRAVYIVQLDPPEANEPPRLSVLIRSSFKGYEDVNDGQGIATLDLRCPICDVTAEATQKILWAWIVENASPQQIVCLTECTYPPSKGDALIDL